MKRRLSLQVISVLVLFGVLLAPASGVNADSTAYTANNPINTSYYTYFPTVRWIWYSPWGVAFMKTDGPATWMKYYSSCAGGSVEGSPQLLPNSDPTDWEQLGYPSLSYGQPFCLAALGAGNNTYDTFSGTVSWDG